LKYVLSSLALAWGTRMQFIATLSGDSTVSEN